MNPFSYRDIARMAGESFLRFGHRRVAMFAASESLASRTYKQSLRQTMESEGGSLPEAFVYHGNNVHIVDKNDEDAITESLGRMFAGPDPPTAILASFRGIGEVVYLAAQKLGLRVPADVSIITIGDETREGAVSRRLTKIALDGAALGRRAADVLEEMFSGQRAIDESEEILLPVRLVERETLGSVLRPKEYEE